MVEFKFFSKTKRLQEYVKECKTLDDIKKLSQELQVQLLIEYHGDQYFSFTENLNQETIEGSVSLAIKVKITDDEYTAIGKTMVGMNIFGNAMTKEDIEREKVKTIIQTLQHLDYEANT